MTNTRKADASDELIELRARVEALEAQQRKGWRPLNTETVYGREPDVDTVRAYSYSVGPGGLVERVAQAMINSPPTPGDWKPEARAAIREVVAWLRTGRLLHAAELLEQEVTRG